ncbi:MAG: four helix bundle protein [Dehalococcoidia bacterium]
MRNGADSWRLSFEAWAATVPAAFVEDPLWRMTVYRLALYLGEIAWADVTQLARDRRASAHADQLYRAIGSISANIAEGYSRSSGPDRARLLEYSLGSAREARDWYYRARHIIGDEAANDRFSLLSDIIRLLLTMLPGQRKLSLKEDAAEYSTDEV